MQHRRRLTVFVALLAATLMITGCAAIPTAAPVSTPDATPGGPALVWQREGGIAGFCDRLTITTAGDAVAESCKAEGTLGRAALDPDQRQQFQEWVGALSGFVVRQSDPATADAMTIVVSFQGAGDRQPTQDEQAAIAEYAATIFAGIASRQKQPLPTAALPMSDQEAATRAAIVAAANRMGVEPDTVHVVSIGAEQWPDSCLAYAQADEICLQAVTPGFRVVVESGGQRLELHTDADGSVVRIAPNPESAVIARDCATGFERRTLQAIDGTTIPSRQTLSTTELNELLRQMGISSICVPTSLGAPFINVDWNPKTIPGTIGRMISLGFENLYEGAGWSNGYVLNSTYDFLTGTEYDVFASEQDRDDLRLGLMENPIEVGGARGFVRYQPSLCYGDCSLFKTTIFPFDDHYIAIVVPVVRIGADEDWEDVAGRIEGGEMAAEVEPVVSAFDIVAQSLRFVGRIPWEEAEQLVLGGKATGIMQTHALEVTLTLADERRVTTIEPSIDQIFRVVDACGHACERMSLATE